MWITNELGIASLEHGPLRLDLDARGGANGIHFQSSNRSMDIIPTLAGRFEPVGDAVLPLAVDQFVRGDEWHVSLPQVAGSYSLDIAFRPIIESVAAGGDPFLVLETTLSIHTSLLDSHPMIDLVLATSGVRRARSIGMKSKSKTSGCAAVTTGDFGSVLLGPCDYPFTSDLSTDHEMRLRLFGEFLEKGVIRKARPWIVLGSPTDEAIQDLWDQLSEAPLPLS